MGTFREAYEAWMQAPFPIGDAEDQTGVLHDDVALVDTWVAESVVPYIKLGSFVPAKAPLVEELHALSNRASELGDADGAPEYLRYVGLLSDVYGAFLRERPT